MIRIVGRSMKNRKKNTRYLNGAELEHYYWEKERKNYFTIDRYRVGGECQQQLSYTLEKKIFKIHYFSQYD